MNRFFRKRTFSRRDILLALSGRLKQDATPGSATGRDRRSRTIDSLVQQGRYEQAISHLQSLLQESPDHLQAMRKLGYCYLQTGSLDRAAEVFQSVLGTHSRDPFALLYLGLALARQGRVPDAIQVWQDYFNTDQPIIQRAVNLQIALFETGGPQDGQEVSAQIEQAVAEQQSRDSH